MRHWHRQFLGRARVIPKPDAIVVAVGGGATTTPELLNEWLKQWTWACRQVVAAKNRFVRYQPGGHRRCAVGAAQTGHATVGSHCERNDLADTR